MKRAALLMAALMLIGVACSSKKPAATNQSPGASSSASAGTTPGASSKASSSASPSVKGSGSSTTSVAPSTPSSGSTSPTSPPAGGVYHYSQTGQTAAGIFSFDADPTGTLAVGAPTAAGSSKRQTQMRHYSDGWSQDETLLFGSDAIRLEQTTMRFGSGGFVQEQTCKPSHPLKAIILPLKVGKTWTDSGTCNGLTVSLTGKVLRTENRTVGGKTVSAFVVHVVTHTTGSGYDINTDLTTWISPQYRLTVRSVVKSSGTAQGNDFTQNLTEDLLKLTPDA